MIRPLLWLPLIALSVSAAAANDIDLREAATKLHQAAGGEVCSEPDEYFQDDAYGAWEISYQPSWTDDEEQKQKVTLISMFCMAGAYNITDSYYLYTDTEGLRPIAFAQPDIDVRYVNDDYEGEVEDISVKGMGTTLGLVNSHFDEETLTITEYSKWRGLGDASSAGTWVFSDGTFSLKKYDVDASYDGEMNPVTIVDYSGEN
ncbi:MULTISPECIES: DUF1176 domain-containing protein [unclassified Devosia]|uniref:DUF1176 domain-containing protein n=1 Tax=unclassified Devosia TaxID=196773 RepID=UPI00145C95DC|nr:MULTISPECIES: DUF1176 domain-containing protein [unclassified Devosia]MBJ6986245.1 DUF1176 domain-containing protein [Devosia sp. MC521]QMW64271.1 DUF1176 domain-containing protein [Devosia sp. MC521]